MNGTMYSITYQCGNQIVWTKGSRKSEVRDQYGAVKFTGTDLQCVRWLAARGDKAAQKELAARK